MKGAVSILSMASMIWLFLVTSSLWSVLWPASFHERFVFLAGGEMQRDASGGFRADVGWGAVLSLTALGFVVICGLGACRSLIANRFIRAGENGSVAVQHSSALKSCFLQIADRLGSVWMVSLIWLGGWLWAEIAPASLMASLLGMTPAFWFAALAAASLCAAWLEGDLVPSRTGPSVPVVVLSAAVILWTMISFWMNERLYAGLWIPHGDSAMYEEHLWNVWHGKGFRSYLDQGLFLGEHIQVIHLLLLPVHMLWPSHLMMELAESICLGICAVPIYRLAHRHSSSSAAAAWLAGAWLLCYPMHFLDIAIDLKTLRPSCYGLPFLLWGIDLAERHRLKWASVCFVIAMSAQEDFALIIAPVGFVLWWNHWVVRKQDPLAAASARWSMGLCILSIVYLLAAVLVIIPAFRAGQAVHYSRYFGDLGSSPGDLIRTTLREPGRVLGQFLSLRTLQYLLVFSVPAGFLLFRSPLRLAAGAGTFVMLSLIQLGQSESTASAGELPPVPYHHFHAPLMPVLFWAAAAGLRRGSVKSGRLDRWLPRTGWFRQQSSETLARFAFGCALFTSITGSMMPVGASFWSPESRTCYWNLYIPGPRAREFAKVLPLLPMNSRIASTDYVHTRLTHFERSYDYSDYLRAVNQYRPGVPEDTDLIVIDTQHPYSKVRVPADVRELREQPEQWEMLPDNTNGYFIVLRRVQETKKAAAKPALRDGSDPETAQPQ